MNNEQPTLHFWGLLGFLLIVVLALGLFGSAMLLAMDHDGAIEHKKNQVRQFFTRNHKGGGSLPAQQASSP